MQLTGLQINILHGIGGDSETQYLQQLVPHLFEEPPQLLHFP